MGRELSDVFKAKTRVGKRKILDKFDISKEDKNKFLNGIENKDDGLDSGESGIEYTYLDLRGYDIGSNYDFLNIIPFASIVNYKGAIKGVDVHYIMTYGYLALVEGDMSKSLALAIDESAVVTDMSTPDSKQQVSIKEAIEMTTAKDLYNSIPRITKEQFYSLE